MNDWRLIRDYYGLPRIVELWKQMRTLDPVCLDDDAQMIPVMFADNSWKDIEAYLSDVVKSFE